MSLTAQNISHEEVLEEIHNTSTSNYKLIKIDSPFRSMYSLKNFYKEDLFILFRKISFAHRRDPNEFRAQISDIKLADFLKSQDIEISNVILAGFFKIFGNDKITLSFFDRLGSQARNRSYYINFGAILEANTNGRSSWYNAEGFEVVTIKTNFFYEELRKRYC